MRESFYPQTFRPPQSFFFSYIDAYLHLGGSVVLAVLVLVGGPVPVSQEAFEAVFALELAHDLVERLAVQGVVVHGERRVADAGQESGVRVLYT